jgi:Carbohydrate binding module (family 35)/Carbohydrate binding module (family 6)/Right handed beta helix region
VSTFRTLRRRSIAIAALAVLAAGAAVLGTQSVLRLAQAAGIQGDVYVSPSGNDANAGTAAAPVKTLQRAQALVRALNQNMSADVTVVIADGFYRLSAPLALGAADSGTNGHNVVWTADTGARPVVAGSTQITSWSRVSASSPIWVAQAPAGLRTRQLYVNGKRADRAHGALPEALTGQNSSGYSGGGTTLGGWRNPSGAKPELEFVYRGGLGAWTEPRCPVGSISGAAVNMAQPCWSNSTTRACCFADGRAYNLVGRQSITEQPTTVENAYQFLSASTPGQWFLDQGDSKLYYVPRSGETMGTADVEAPVLEKLVDGVGTPSAPVHNIVFNGLQFSYATWLGPNFHGASSSDGFSEIQANYQVTGANGAASQGLCHVPPPTYTLGACPFGAWTQIPGNVSFVYDQNIQFTGDAFVHLGAAGLALGDGTQHALVKGNIVTDISGNGIQVGNVDMPTATGASQTSNNTVSDNHVFNLPAEYRGGIGVDSGYTANDTISHNQIDNTPYTAVSQGWGGWPDKEKEAPQPNFSHDNAIANNLIFNHMLLLNDGGGIYTQGITGTSLTNGEKVTGNVIHNQTGSGHAIYTDNGATFETIKGNAVYDNVSANAWSSRHNDYAPGATTTYDPTDVENNYFENPPGYTSGNGLTVANNTTITGASGVPSSILSAAGLETAYKGLLNWVQAPLPPVPGSNPGVTRYEAESGTCDGTIDSNHAGFSGTGFCNLTNAVGSAMTWTVNASAAGSATLTFGWANGTTVNRPTTVSVNGGAPVTVNFPSTGTWESWTTTTITVTLNAGANTVKATSTTADGGPNFDYVDVASASASPSPTPTSGPTTTRYEAESGTCDGTIDSNHAGFSGTGFCNVTNAIGSSMTWTLTGRAGSATLTFRYSNGTTVNRPTAISVNGAAAVTVNFPSTGTWDTWASTSITVTLAAGTNTVKATSTTADGAPNLDYLDVTQ